MAEYLTLAGWIFAVAATVAATATAFRLRRLRRQFDASSSLLTELAAAQTGWRLSERRFGELFDYARVGICTLELGGRFIRVNPVFAAITGYDAEALCRRTFQEITHPEDLPADLENRNRLLAGAAEHYSAEKRYLRPDGSIVWVSITVALSRREDGRPDYLIATAIDITEGRKAETALRDSEERLRLALAAANQGLFDLNVQTGEATVSPEYATMLGYDPATFRETNEHWIERLHPADHERVATTFRAYISGQIPEYAVEFRQRTREGAWKWILSLGKVVARDREGRPLRMLGTHTDITDRRQVEMALQVSEDLLRRSQAVARLGSYYLNARTGTWISSPALDDIFGIDGDFTRDTNGWLNLVAPEEREAMRQYLADYVLGRHNQFDREYRIVRHSDGARRWVHGLGRLEYDPDGSITKMIGTIQDITERKEAELELEMFRFTVEQATDEIVWLRPDGRFDYVNEQTCRMLGYRREEFAHLSLWDIDRDFSRTAWEANLRRFREGRQGGTAEIESFQVRKNGERFPVEVRARHLWFGDRELHVAVVRDITDRKRAEAEQQRLINELEAKNAELERFTYTVSHDLKSPLITIKGFAGALLQDVAARRYERIEADLRRITHATDKMATLLNDLLKLSRVGRLIHPPSDINLGALAHEVADLLAGPLTKSGVELVIAPDLPVIRGDRQRLAEVLQNLMENAIRFRGEQAAPRIEVGAQESDHEWTIWVQDNGQGIAPQYHESVFGLFHTLDARADGTGIGLALVRRIVEVHGGRVWVESEGAGRGATFRFTLKKETA